MRDYRADQDFSTESPDKSVVLHNYDKLFKSLCTSSSYCLCTVCVLDSIYSLKGRPPENTLVYMCVVEGLRSKMQLQGKAPIDVLRPTTVHKGHTNTHRDLTGLDRSSAV